MNTLKIKSLLTVALLMIGVETFAYDFHSLNDDGKDIYYKVVSATECQVTYVSENGSSNCNYYSGSLKIPSSAEYNGRALSVTSIGKGAFRGCKNLTSVTIPTTVKSIDEDAFGSCSGLTSLTIPNSVTSIGDWAFGYCSGLTSIIIPNSVTSIGARAFLRCIHLTSVTIPNSVTSLGASAFSECERLTAVTIPNSITSIEEEVFKGCEALTSVEIPNSVTSIGSNAFSVCLSLTSIEIPNSVTSIGSEAFQSSGLTSVKLSNSLTRIEYYTFKWCSNLVSITIPRSVNYIGSGAFEGCKKLSTVRMESENPIYCTVSPFDRTGQLIAITLEVPNGSKSAYASASVWEDFWEIVEYEASGINEVHGDAAPKYRKYLDNGHVVIVNDNKQFTIDGKKL